MINLHSLLWIYRQAYSVGFMIKYITKFIQKSRKKQILEAAVMIMKIVIMLSWLFSSMQGKRLFEKKRFIREGDRFIRQDEIN